METQRGRAGAVIEEPRAEVRPYVASLVVPPITAPIRRPTPEMLRAATVSPVRVDAPFSHEIEVRPEPSEAPAFRRDREHRAVLVPSFPEPPTRCSLGFDDLAAAVSPASGRATSERLDVFEHELALRDVDRARLAAWEALVHPIDDPELDAARVFVRAVFADLAVPERVVRRASERVVRRAAEDVVRRAADRSSGEVVLRDPAPEATGVADATPALLSVPPIPDLDLNAIEATVPVARMVPTPIARAVPPIPASVVEPAIPELVEPARPVSPPVATVLAAPIPTLVPATTPEITFTAAIRAHELHTGEVPLTFPLTPVRPADRDDTAPVAEPVVARPSWWARFVAALLAPFRRNR